MAIRKSQLSIIQDVKKSGVLKSDNIRNKLRVFYNKQSKELPREIAGTLHDKGPQNREKVYNKYGLNYIEKKKFAKVFNLFDVKKIMPALWDGTSPEELIKMGANHGDVKAAVKMHQRKLAANVATGRWAAEKISGGMSGQLAGDRTGKNSLNRALVSSNGVKTGYGDLGIVDARSHNVSILQKSNIENGPNIGRASIEQGANAQEVVKFGASQGNATNITSHRPSSNPPIGFRKAALK